MVLGIPILVQEPNNARGGFWQLFFSPAVAPLRVAVTLQVNPVVKTAAFLYIFKEVFRFS